MQLPGLGHMLCVTWKSVEKVANGES
jgi:hypothetical protein